MAETIAEINPTLDFQTPKGIKLEKAIANTEAVRTPLSMLACTVVAALIDTEYSYHKA